MKELPAPGAYQAKDVHDPRGAITLASKNSDASFERSAKVIVLLLRYPVLVLTNMRL
jgi:hypothetical protein